MAEAAASSISGSALRWNGRELSDESEITSSLLKLINPTWNRLANKRWKDLPLAGQNSRSRFQFDDFRQVFTLNGTPMPKAAIARAVEAFSFKAGNELKALSGQLLDASLTLEQWQTRFAEQLRTVHLTAASIGRGGIAELTQDDLDLVQARVRDQLAFVDRFARHIETGDRRAATPAQIRNRSQQYSGMVNATYHEIDRRSHEDAGFDQERRVLGAAEHCETCIEQAALEWQANGFLRPIGDSICRFNCKCRFEHRRSEDEE